MKWLLGSLFALALAASAYAGHAIRSVGQMVQAARVGDAAFIMERTNVRRLQGALVGQVMGAYEEQQAKNRKLSPFQRMALNAYGSTIADAIIGKLLTSENLGALLRTGALRNASEGILFDGLPPLAQLETDQIPSLLARFEFVKPVEFALQLGRLEDESAVSFHLDDDWQWRLSGIKLPNRVLKDVAARLPSP